MEENKKLVTVPSEKKRIANGYQLTVRFKDMPRNAEDLVAAVKVNGQKEKQKVTEQKKKTKKFNAKYLIPLLLVVAIPIMCKTCKKEEVVEIPIKIALNDIENPYLKMEAIVNSAGQEGLTANLSNNENFEGKYYSAEEQTKAEERAVSNVLDFEETKNAINENLQLLLENDKNPEQKYAAAQSVLSIYREINDAYLNNKDFVEEFTNKFHKASEAFPDKNTEKESVAIELMKAEFLEQFGLSSENVNSLKAFVWLYENEFDVNISSVEEQTHEGDYIITGEAVRKVAEGEDIKDALKSVEDLKKILNYESKETVKDEK